MALMLFLDVTRHSRGEGFVTASVQMTAVLGAHHNPVQDMAGYVDELSQVVITQNRPQTAHLSVRTIIIAGIAQWLERRTRD